MLKKLLIKIFGEKRLVDAKVIIDSKPYEFITNPPAAEIAEKNRLAIEAKRDEDNRLAKIRERQQFILNVDKSEKNLDKQIRKRIDQGLTSITVIHTAEDSREFFYSENCVAYYLAARRFRNRGFKLEIKKIRYPVWCHTYNKTAYEWNRYDVPKTIPLVTTHELILSWD